MCCVLFRYFIVLCFACLGFAVSGANAWAQSRSLFLDFGQTTYTPTGWAEFCVRYKGDCEQSHDRTQEIISNDANVALIYRVNKQVNDAIKPLPDVEHWRQIDRWDYAEDGSGDCEDYALVKRKLLLAAGLPQGALLMTVVRDKNSDGHAVLTVRTDRGDLVLDNMSDQLHLWFRTPYRFVKIQSQRDPNTWVTIGAGTTRPQIVSR